MIKMTPTNHMADRADRLATIIMRVGLGEIVQSAPNPKNEGTFLRLTSTGIVLVMTEKDVLITGFMCSKTYLRIIYGEQKPPRDILRTVNRNMEKHIDLWGI